MSMLLSWDALTNVGVAEVDDGDNIISVSAMYRTPNMVQTLQMSEQESMAWRCPLLGRRPINAVHSVPTQWFWRSRWFSLQKQIFLWTLSIA